MQKVISEATAVHASFGKLQGTCARRRADGPMGSHSRIGRSCWLIQDRDDASALKALLAAVASATTMVRSAIRGPLRHAKSRENEIGVLDHSSWHQRTL